VVRTIRSDHSIAGVFSAFNTRNSAFVSKDGRSTYVVASFKPMSGRAETDAGKRIKEKLKGTKGILLGGPIVANTEIDDQIGSDLARAEMVGIPILIVLSLLFFRGVVASLLPLAVGLVSIAGTFLLLRITNEIVQLSVFAINLVTGLGLGLAIDYSLFVVSRYREELARRGPGPSAIAATLATAGRTVAFSALTVAAALAALFVFPQRFLYSMAFGGVFVSLLSTAVALVFLPALLAVLGPRVNAISPGWLRRSAERAARNERSGLWYAISHGVMRRALPIAVVSAALLIALGIPFLGVKFIGVDAGVLPKDASARQVQDMINANFAENETSPIYLAVSGTPADAARIRAFRERLRSLPNALAATPPQQIGRGTWRIDVFSQARSLDDRTQTLVKQIRREPHSFGVLVGGEAAAFADQQSSFRSRLPYALAVVCLTTALLLFLMTGSLVLPIKTLVMNLLSLTATLGFLVLVFQHGHLEGLLNYTSQHALNATQPILIGVIAFALSTDYAVFLLTRIKEARDRGESSADAVAIGIERTGRIVTAAALMLAVAIGAFVTSKIILIKELGVGVAFAVLLDATVVRALLVPSLMRLLGEWNWWAPNTLRRLYVRFGLSHG
jgi:RND superfamily putative drug exporter